MIKEYEYNLNHETYEIFPADVCHNPMIVFHGTSLDYSEGIEKNGFIPGFSPFDPNLHEDLLASINLLPYEKLTSAEQKSVDALREYILRHRAKLLKTSFSPHSGFCVNHAVGEMTGGQIFRKFKECLTIFRLHIAQSDIFKKYLVSAGQNTGDTKQGVVYAIELPFGLDGVELSNNTIYSRKPILPERIVGKVIIPEEIDLSKFEYLVVSRKLSKKLTDGVLLSKLFL